MRGKKLVKKAATLLLVLLMLGSLFGGVTATAGDGEPDAAYGATNPDYRVSDSPYLRLPDDLKDYPPIVPPEPHEAKDMEDPSAIEMYNTTTGEVIRIPSNESGELGLNLMPPFEGLLPPGVVPETVFPPDDRERIHPDKTYPWRTIGKLFLTYPDGATGWCSGAIIGCPSPHYHGYIVLTAGHCVYDHDHGGWASSAKFVPGLDEDYMPYNFAYGTNLYSFVGWTQYGDYRYDMGFVILDRNVGDYTGWMGRITAGPDDEIYDVGVNTAGYPSDKPMNTMWWDFDDGLGTIPTDYHHGYMMDTYKGQSGSPVWLYNYFGEGKRYIATVHAYGGTSYNYGCRLDNTKFDAIYDICDAETPPTDYADLIDDGQAYSGFSPTTVKPGTTSFHAWCDVRNVGTASSGGFYVCYYASENTVISTYDYLIGCDYVSSIDPFSWKDSDWTGTFPSGIPDGEYWVGWIIDSENDVPELLRVDEIGNNGETNNVAYKDSYKLLVDGTPPSATISINNGATYTTTTSVTLSLTYSDGGSGVDKCRYKNSGGSWTSWQACTPTKAWTLTSGDGTKTVYYRVRDKAGNIRQVYDTIILDTTNPPAPVISSSTHPDENKWYCNRNPTFTWTTPSDPSGIACYSYTLDHSPSTTPDTTCDTTGNSKSYTNLADGIWYFHVRAKDNAGNWGSADHYRVKIDTAKPPAPSPDDGVEGWSNDNTPTFTWDEPSDTSGIAGYYWKVDSGSDHWTTSTSVTLPAQPDGEHTFYVKAKDNAGNIGDYGSHKFKIDTTPPSSEVKELPEVQTSRTFTVSWEGSDALSGIRWYDVQYKKDDGSWTDWLAHTTLTSGQFTGACGHTYYFRCRARDNAGNWEDYGEADTYTYINCPPNKPSNPHPPNGATNVPINTSLSWSCSDPDGDALKYDIYLGTSIPPPLVKSNHTSTTYDPILENNTTYYWKVVAKDGYAETEGDIWSFTTASPDTTPPETEIIEGPSGKINYSDVRFVWTGKDDRTPTSELVYAYKLEGYDADWSWTSDTSKNYYSLPNGDYTFKVKAKDKAGNVDPTPAERTFTVSVENQPPVVSFTYSPQHPKVNENITFNASSSYDPDGTIVKYEWDFGDGNITNTTHEIINHSYSEAGSYNVTLTVTDDKGAKNSTTKMITVMPAPPSVFISTDKYEYTAGDVMLINITIKNPSERKSVKFLWCLDITDYDKHFTIIDNRSLLLPPLYDKTFTLRWKLPKLKSSFNASWHVAIFNKTTSELISEDHADWKYVAAKAKKMIPKVKELKKSVREIEIPF